MGCAAIMPPKPRYVRCSIKLCLLAWLWPHLYHPPAAVSAVDHGSLNQGTDDLIKVWLPL